MRLVKITATEFNDEVIRQFECRNAPANLVRDVKIVCEWILELPNKIAILELVVSVLKFKNKKYRVYPKTDKYIIAVLF